MKHLNQTFSIKASCLVIMASLSMPSYSTNETFSDAPLFLQSGVQPNIMFGVDDSGSMGWETVVPANVLTEFPNLEDGRAIVDIDPTLSDGEELAHSCPGSNLMYYDPTKTYTPWVGVDEDGNEYTDANISSARKNPYDPDGGTYNLNANGLGGFPPGYFPWFDLDNDGEWDPWDDKDNDGIVDFWDDTNGNGVVDFGESEFECPTWMTWDDSDSDSDNHHYDNLIPEATLKAWFIDTSEMDAAQKQNFANWYSYYRKREYVAKRALSTIVSDSVARMGLRTLHNNGSVSTNVKDVDDISSPTDATAVTNKKTLMQNIFKIYSQGGTPLRKTLENIGDYFESTSGPILGEDEGGQCQQNFVILMSDGEWNGKNSNVPNVGNTDGDDDTVWDGGTYADTYHNTLADVAMDLYERDLRPSATFENNVPTQENIDENSAQHIVTYTVTFGVSGTLDLDVPPDDPSFPGWPEPTRNTPQTIDDSWHAAYNGRGLYLNAQDPQVLIDSLNESIQDIQTRTGTASTVAVTSGSYNSLAMSFRAQFDSVDWEGRIQGIPLVWNVSEEVLELDTDNIVNASIIPKAADRHIVTYSDADGDGDKEGTPFLWDNLMAEHQAEIESEDILNFIRGDASNEVDNGGAYRNRTVDSESEAPLGDIIHSSPTYVGDPRFRYPDNLESATYSSYRLDPDGDGVTTTLSLAGQDHIFYRKPMLYVGANDGMLHGFQIDPDPTKSSEFGQEVFAYVPSMVMDRLPKLARKNYRHTYTVDGAPYVGDAFINGEWRTILVAGLNSGGQGIYAIDISEPQNFTSAAAVADYVLWEFSDEDHANLGFTFSVPTIAKANNGQWVAIFGNGYNSNYTDDNTGLGTASLYIVNLETGALVKHIDTGVKQLDASNGLSSPTTVDANGDYVADYVYAGDLEGNLWKFDISSSDEANWDVAHNSGSSNLPLFTACSESTCDADNRQPITVQPQVTLNKGANKGFLIYFGTGSYLFNSDLQDTDLQTLYGIWDKTDNTLTQFDRDHLLKQEIVEEKLFKKDEILKTGAVVITDSWQRRVTDNKVYWHTSSGLPADGSDPDSDIDTHLGWYLDLVINDGKSGDDEYLGERSIVNPSIRGNFVEFSTLIPDPDPCSAGGDGWLMRLNPATGGQPTEPVIDINQDGVVNEMDLAIFDTQGSGESEIPSSGTKLSEISSALGECVYMVMPNGSEVCIKPEETIEAPSTIELGRWTWRELDPSN